MHDIFLSYSRKDNKIMQRVKQSFRSAGLQVWTDEGIEPGTDDWQNAIEEAIKDTKALVCLASPDAKNSRWVKAELKRAELRKKAIFLILIRGDELDSIPFGFEHHQFTDTRPPNDYDTKINRLISAIQQKIGGKKKPTAKELLPAPFDWCEIPPGQVILEGRKGSYIPEGERQTFDVPAFYIAKYPITNAQYKLFVDDGGYKNEQWWVKLGWQAKAQGWGYDLTRFEYIATDKAWTEPLSWRDNNFNGEEQPVVGISWYEAIAFCLWLKEKTDEKVLLPTDQQWQRAAQGDDGRIYPWGNNFDKHRANTGESSMAKTTVVTAYPQGASPYGVLDMVGNSWEWCLTSWDSGKNNVDTNNVVPRLLRGGFWYETQATCRNTIRLGAEPFVRGTGSGFRICTAIWFAT